MMPLDTDVGGPAEPRYRPPMSAKEQRVSQPWRDVVEILAGPEGAMRMMDAAGWDANVVAEVVVPGGLFRSRGDHEEEAWRGVAHSLGDFRLVQALEAAGWTEIDEVIDETTYVVARDRDGMRWAIGVAAADGDRRGYIERDIGFDGGAFDRVAFIDPLDTRDSGALLAALEANV